MRFSVCTLGYVTARCTTSCHMTHFPRNDIPHYTSNGSICKPLRSSNSPTGKMRVALKTKPLVISFEKTPDGDYQLVRDGDIDADTHFGFAFDMACKRLNISYKRRGYSGSATHSSSTFAFAQEVPEEALMAATVALAELPTAELARQLIEGGVFGPRADEPGFSQFDEHTDAETLKEWAIAYYQANRIDDPESLACLERNTLFRFRQVAVAALQHNLRGAY